MPKHEKIPYHNIAWFLFIKISKTTMLKYWVLLISFKQKKCESEMNRFVFIFVFLSMQQIYAQYYGAPVKLSCTAKVTPHLIQDNIQYRQMAGYDVPEVDFKVNTILGAIVHTGGVPVIGYDASAHYDQNIRYITINVYLEGRGKAYKEESVWLLVPKIELTDNIEINISYETLNLCNHCDFRELPKETIRKDIVRDRIDYEDIFVGNATAYPKIDFDKQTLIGIDCMYNTPKIYINRFGEFVHVSIAGSFSDKDAPSRRIWFTIPKFSRYDRITTELLFPRPKLPSIRPIYFQRQINN